MLLTTGTDTIIGTAGNDVINGTSATYGSADVIIDSTTTDNDTLNLAITGVISATPTVANIENVNVTFTGFTASGNTTLAFAADNIGANTNFNFVAAGTTAVTTLNPTALATGSTITADSTFNAITLTGDDNAALTVNGAARTATSTVTVTASATSGALTNVTANVTTGSLSLQSTASDGAITATAAQDVTVNAAAATSAVITAGDDVTITSLAAATDVSITAGDDVSAGADTLDAATTLSITAGGQVDADFDAALTATISAKGVNSSATGGVDEISTLTGDVATTLNLSGNGGAVDFDITGVNLAKTLNISGDQAVKVLMDIGDIDGLAAATGLTVNNTNTGTTTLSISGTLGAAARLSNVATSTAIQFTADMQDGGTAAKVITLANGAGVTFQSAQGATSVARFSASSSTASTNAVTFTMDKPNATTSTDAIGSMTTTNIKNVTVNLDRDTASTTLGTIDVGASNNLTLNLGVNALTAVTDITASTLTITGSGDLTLADLSISALNASAASGDITYQVAAGDVVQTGSGDDTISGLNNMDASLSLGAGNDSVTLTGDLSDNTVVLDMGAGTVDSINLANNANINGAGVVISGLEKITFDGAAATLRDTQLSGQTYQIFGTTGTTHGITIGVTQATNDFSDLVIDTATFGTGNDYFTISASSSTAAVTITGSDANDRITGATGGTGVYADVLNGGAGADTLFLTEGGDTIDGGTGIDTLDLSVIDGTSLGGFTDIEGGTSNASGMVVNLGATAIATTTLATNFDGNFLSRGLTSVASGKAAYLFATDAATNSAVVASFSNIENVNGSEGADYIVGSVDANVINGDAGADYIDGGAGNDTINGGAGADNILGGTGDDSITGGAGADTINAGAGTNTVTDAGDGADVITHNTASSTVAITVTGTGTVTLTATQAGASATGADGGIRTVNASTSTAAVSLTGGDGADVLTGGSGADTLIGGAGADTITTGAGADTVTGGAGIDTITFGDGVDTLVLTGITAAANRDVVTGFTAGTDKITTDISGAASAKYAEVTISSDAVAIASGKITEITATLSESLATATDGTELIAALKAANSDKAVILTNEASGTAPGLIVAYQGGKAYLYAFANAATDGLVASEIALVGVFNGITAAAFGAGDFGLT